MRTWMVESGCFNLLNFWPLSSRPSRKKQNFSTPYGQLISIFELVPITTPKPSKVDFRRVFQCQPSNFKTSQNSPKHKVIFGIFHRSCLVDVSMSWFDLQSLNSSVSYKFFIPLVKSAIRLQISQMADPQQPFKHEWSEMSKSPPQGPPSKSMTTRTKKCLAPQGLVQSPCLYPVPNLHCQACILEV